jgi:hypothetical protein
MRARGKRMRWIGLAVVVLLAIAGAAVLALSKSADPVSAAITKSEDAGGAKLALTVTADDGSGQPVTVTAGGLFDQSDADITIDASGLPANAGLAGASGPIEVRYLQENGDPVVYANVPRLASFIPGGKSWVKLDLAQAAQKLGVKLPGTASAATQNPGQLLDLLRSVGSVETVGAEEQALVSHLIANGAPTSIPVDVWIGDDGLVHKLTFNESVGGHSGGLTLDISDYGTPVTVTAPDANDTLDATGLVGMLGSLPSSGGLTLPGMTH